MSAVVADNGYLWLIAEEPGTVGRGKRERNCVHEPQCIVLDKSFVRSASSKQVREVCENYRALMPEDLFFELIHSDEVTKAKCFAKFPARESPVGLLPPVGVLIQSENEYRRPCTPIWNHRLHFNYRFNGKLATGEFELTHQQLAGVRKWEEDLATETANFAERAKLIINIFPILEGYRPGQDRSKINEVLHDIASNMEGVRRFYRWVAPEGFAPASIVGRPWAVFRYIQVHLTADVEFLASYGIDVNQPKFEKLENERTDLNYLVLAVLAKGWRRTTRP
ncbi:MAG TPA: hypothetical protein VJ725_03625 [Thermoanaerobaculia bacterium]|nr:hypothetical protein [Thermoanaerobaculia bacterium]